MFHFKKEKFSNRSLLLVIDVEAAILSGIKPKPLLMQKLFESK